MKKDPIHEKAIKLIEGGQVDVDGHCIRLKYATGTWNSCMQCKMDSICRKDGEMYSVCMECDYITQDDCYLELVTNDKEEEQ